MRKRNGLWALAALCVTSLAAGPAAAVSFTLKVTQAGSYQGTFDETDLGCGNGNTANCAGGGVMAGDLSLDSWSVLVDSDPVVSGTVAVTNTATTDQQFTLVFTLGISPAITPSSLIGGSIQGGVTDNNGDGATLKTVLGSSFYTARIDGTGVQSLYSHNTTVTAGAFLSQNLTNVSFGTPIPSQAGPAALSTIGIVLDFVLSPGDSASFTSNFVVQAVPEPTILAMLGAAMAGLWVMGRPRRIR